MTLIITVVTRNAIFQSADYRLTDTDTGKTTDGTTKLVVLQYENWHGFVSYTGIATSEHKDTVERLKVWLKAFEAPKPIDVAMRIAQYGSTWLERIRTKNVSHKRHTFVLTAFEDVTAQVFVISNFEDCFGRSHKTLSPLTVTTRKFTGNPLIFVNGVAAAVPRALRQKLKALLRVERDEPGRVRRMLTQINEDAAKSKAAEGAISLGCSTASFWRDGRGELDPHGNAEMHSIVNGIAAPARDEQLKRLGFDGGMLVGATFFSTNVPMQLMRCEPHIINPKNSSYALSEVKHPELSSMSAIAVSNSGWLVGNGTARSNEQCAWKARLGDLTPVPSNAVGSATRVNDQGSIAGQTKKTDGFSSASLWIDNRLVDLGVVKERDSGATSINSHGVVVGWVSIGDKNRGQLNWRPAICRGGVMVELEMPQTVDWANAVDINDQGQILGVGYREWDCHAILWNPDHSLARVLKPKGIYPTAIISDGTILGTVNNHAGLSVACKASPGRDWEQLGLSPGFYLTAMNDSGVSVGACVSEGYEKPWLRRANGEVVWLPFFRHHGCRPAAINNSDVIVGAATSDHGSHALLWEPRDRGQPRNPP